MNIFERTSYGFIMFLKKSNSVKLDIQAIRNAQSKTYPTSTKGWQTSLVCHDFLSHEVFYKKAILINFAIFTGKQLFWSLLLCKYCEIFKNTYFEEHL